MKTRNTVTYLISIALLIIGVWWLRTGKSSASSEQPIEAIGTIEARQVGLSSEIGGKVVEVLVEEGQVVEANQPIIRLDDSLLMAQREVAEAGLAAAQSAAQTAQLAYQTSQAQYQITLAAALEQDRSIRLNDWFSQDQKNFDQPAWYFTRLEQMQAAQTQVDEAKKALEDSVAALIDTSNSLDETNFLATEERLINARLAYLISKDVKNRTHNSATSNDPKGFYNATHCGTNKGFRLKNAQLTNQVYGCTGDDQLTEAGNSLYDDAREELDLAQQAYDKLLTNQAVEDVQQARADVSVAQERFYEALDRWYGLQTGDRSPSVTAAKGAMDQAQAAFDQSQKAVSQAQANLSLLDIQIEKLTLTAPSDGIVLSRSIEPGGMAVPGAIVIEIGRLDNLELTVYLPEEKFGQVMLGQSVYISVDAYPGQSFDGKVLRLANEAEFTPTNVQTKEDRTRLVYAVTIGVDNPDLLLKPGMIADVTFE